MLETFRSPMAKGWLKKYFGIGRDAKDRDGQVDSLNRPEALAFAAKSMIRFKSPRRLIRMIVRYLEDYFKLTHAGALLYDAQRSCYVLIVSRGKEGKQIPAGLIRLTRESPLIHHFTSKKERSPLNREIVLYRDVLETFLHETTPRVRERLLQIREEMELLKAEVCVPCPSRKRGLLGVLILGSRQEGGAFSRAELDVFLTLTADVAVAIENAQLYEELYQRMREIEGLYEREKRLFRSTTRALANAVDAKDRYTHGHVERVTHYCGQVWAELREMGYKAAPDFEEFLYIGALLHDIGKIGTPDHILNKKGPLTDQEFEIMKGHAMDGAKILEPIAELRDAALAIKYHQERWDGKGYPEGLRGEQIPLVARIVTVADAFDAMVTDRPYRPRMLHNVAVSEMRRCAGSQFDPKVVEAFLRAYNKGKIVHFHREDSKPPEPARQPEAAQGQDLTQPSSQPNKVIPQRNPKSDDMEGPGLAAAS